MKFTNRFLIVYDHPQIEKIKLIMLDERMVLITTQEIVNKFSFDKYRCIIIENITDDEIVNNIQKVLYKGRISINTIIIMKTKNIDNFRRLLQEKIPWGGDYGIYSII